MRAGPIVLLAKFLAYSNTITCSTLIAHCFLMLRRVGNLGIRYYFCWRLDLAAVHLTVALGSFAMDTSTVQQNGGYRIPWGRGEGRGGRNDYFCRLLFDVILLSFNLSPSTWVFPLCESVRHGLFPVKAMRRGPTGIRPTQQLRHTETVFPRNLSIGMPASLTGLRGVKFI